MKINKIKITLVSGHMRTFELTGGEENILSARRDDGYLVVGYTPPNKPFVPLTLFTDHSVNIVEYVYDEGA